MILCWFDVFLQKSEQFKILLIDGPLIGTATTEVRHWRIGVEQAKQNLRRYDVLSLLLADKCDILLSACWTYLAFGVTLLKWLPMHVKYLL